MAATNDQTIISLFEQRNEQALLESEQKYGALCRSVAQDITGSNEDAEECLDDALLAAWNAIPPAKPQSFCAYLLRLVRNSAFDRYRANHTEKREGSRISFPIDEIAEIIPDGNDVISETERRELLAAIKKFLSGLSRKQRDLFVRRYWFASSIAELAELFGMTEGNVKKTLSRLRKRLQQYLIGEGLL